MKKQGVDTGKILLVYLCWICVAYALQAQTLCKEQFCTPVKYIYKITDKQALRITSGKEKAPDTSYFSQYVDTTSQEAPSNLPPGIYLIAGAENRNLVCQVHKVIPFTCNILNNQEDLSISVLDNTTGRVIPDARVYINHTRIGFDRESQTYRRHRTDKEGWITVEVNGVKDFFPIKKGYNRSIWTRLISGAANLPILKYLLRPVIYTCYLPHDIILSIKHHYAIGTVYRMKNIPRTLLSKNKNSYNKSRSTDQSFIVLNKPTFRPSDTVKVRAFLTDKKGIPLNKPVRLSLYYWNNRESKTINIDTIPPLRPGVYVAQFALKSSYNLFLDRDYRLELSDLKEHDLKSISFHYEDYELRSAVYDMALAQKKYKVDEPVQVTLRAHDDNHLPLPDARADLSLEVLSVEQFDQQKLNFPKTIWQQKIQIDPSGESVISIPDSVFPSADLELQLSARFNNSENQGKSQKVRFTHRAAKDEIFFARRNDSLLIEYRSAGHSVSKKGAKLVTTILPDTLINLPALMPINPLVSRYAVSCKGQMITYNLDSEEADIHCMMEHTGDSLWVKIDNPLRLPLAYTLFRKNKEIARGNGITPSIRIKASHKQKYFLSVQYVWGGRVKSAEYASEFNTPRMKINTIVPPVIYPGQKVEVKVAVTDGQDRPIPDVDLMALGYTAKFDKDLSIRLPYERKQSANRTIFNTFTRKDYKNESISSGLDYQQWMERMRLDTIEMYKFAYPQDGHYRLELPSPNSKSMIAPYLVHEGRILPVNLLYIDNQLVYTNEATSCRPYWFEIAPGKHVLKIRNMDKLVMLNIETEANKKYILSYDPDKYPLSNIKAVKDKYNAAEQKDLIRHMIPIIPYKYSDNFTYLQQGDSLFDITGSINRRKVIAGPFTNNDITFHAPGQFKRTFRPDDEPFEYEFLPDVTKMRSSHRFNTLKRSVPSLNFGESILTQKHIDSLYQSFALQKIHEKVIFSGLAKDTATNIFRFSYQLPDRHVTKALGWVLYDKASDKYGIYRPEISQIENLPVGHYLLMLLWDDLSYSTVDTLDITPDRYLLRNYTQSDFHLSSVPFPVVFPMGMPTFYSKVHPTGFTYAPTETPVKNIKANPGYVGTIKIHGVVVDANDKSPLVGAVVRVEGTSKMTLANLDGVYNLEVPEGYRQISFSYIGYETGTVLQRGSGELNVALEPNHFAMNEVVVVGYGMQRKASLTGAITGALPGVVASQNQPMNTSVLNILSKNAGGKPLYVVDGIICTDISNIKQEDILTVNTLKDAAATAIYGARGENGVVIITTRKGSAMTDARQMMQKLLSDEGYMSKQAAGIRDRFSDEAFWQPSLRTDKNGIATFETTFPDDITRWKTWYVGVLPRKSSAMTSAEIRSFIPVSAGLSLPRFLTRGDKTNVIGKTVNYTGDTVRVETSFSINNKMVNSRHVKLLQVHVDTLAVRAEQGDSLQIAYSYHRTDGLKDGERRSIPVIRCGTEETMGEFLALDNDTTITIQAQAHADAYSTIVYAESDAIESVKKELIYMDGYQHLCNEQCASKLKALLVERMIDQAEGKAFRSDSKINRLIGKLEKACNENKLWGWWSGMSTEVWISIHVLEALNQARSAGFEVKSDFSTLKKELLWLYDSQPAAMRIRILGLFQTLEPGISYIDKITSIRPDKKSMSQQLSLLELKVRYGKVNVDSLMQSSRKDLFGNLYWSDSGDNLLENGVEATLSAYRILRTSGKYPQQMAKIRNYLLSQRHQGCWRNTYESAHILETIVPDMVEKGGKLQKSQLEVSGHFNLRTDSLPVRFSLPSNSAITVRKKGSYPVYITSYSKIFRENPEPINKGFAVTTRWEKATNRLKAGVPVKLITEVNVKEDQEYVMVEIPIPAGCSYSDKSETSAESHRESFADKVCIYLRKLPRGKSTFEVNLEPRFTGEYKLNPAKAEKMYFPVFYGRTGVSGVNIGE